MGMMSDSEKERLCRDLLAEFGATGIKEARDGELRHSCVLPFGNHPRGDRHASASLNYRKLTYICYTCGGGGLLWFIGICRGTSGDDARKWIERETGTGTEVQDLSALLRYFDSLYEERRDDTPIPHMADSVLTPWLQPVGGFEVHPYWTEMRHIPVDVAKEFRLGYNAETERVVIPHFWREQLVGWQTRRLWNDGSPKYLSSPDFPKNETIYNYDSKQSPTVVVESPMSVIARSHLQPHIEATFGAMVTDKQVRLLSMHREVVLFFDNDEAGWSATAHVADALEPYSSVYVVQNPWEADAADVTDEEYRRLVTEAVPYTVWRRPPYLKRWVA